MPGLFHHAGIAVEDVAEAKTMYAAAVAPLGLEIFEDAEAKVSIGSKAGADRFFLLKASSSNGSTGVHVAFNAASQDDVKAFYEAALKAGFKDNGAPGPRPQYVEGYYGAFVLDKQGNNIEAVHLPFPCPGILNHVGVSLDNYKEDREPYLAALKPLGVTVQKEFPEYGVCGLGKKNEGRPYWLWQAKPGQKGSRGICLGFYCSKEEVQAFYDAATKTGFKSVDPPRLYPEYASGDYFGTFLLDKVGNNIHATNDSIASMAAFNKY